MENGVFFSLISLVYCVLLLIVFFSKERLTNQANDIYKRIIVVNLLGLVIECFLGSHIARYIMTLTPGLGILVLRARLIYFIAWICLFTLYITSLCVGDKELKRNEHFAKTDLVVKLLAVYFGISSLIILLLPLYLYKRGNVSYVYGPGKTATYILGGILLVFSIIMLIKNRKKILNKKYVPILLFILIAVVITIIQAKAPELSLMMPLQTFITFLMYFTIENPDMKLIKELEEAKEAADNASVAKTEFLSSVSHEIRTPLNVIVSLGQYISKASTLEEARENAKDIVSASNTLLDTVNGILDISQIEKGQVEITNSPYDAKVMLEEIGKNSSHRFLSKGLTYSYSIAKDLPKTLLGDHLTLKKIVNNLLTESLKTTTKGFIRYEVNCINKDNISKLIISIEDSGKGIKQDTLEKIFNEDNYRKKVNVIADDVPVNIVSTKRLVELMGGKLIINSIANQTTKYTVIINQRVKETSMEEEVTLDLSDINILIVDDNTLNLKVTSKLLHHYKANKITCVESGFDCLEKIKNGQRFDLILLDDMMPKMSGVETLVKLKGIPTFYTPVVALTANAIVGMREKYIKAGFNDYLAKPLEKDDLIRVLNEVLNKTVSNDENKFVSTKGSRTEIIPVEDNIEELLDTNISSMNLSDKVEISSEVLELEPEIKYDQDYLEKNGIVVERGIELLGDLEMYNETLQDFVNGIEKRLFKLDEYIADMPNYAIEVHALKSDAKYLGITAIADMAYKHELKSKENNNTYIKEHHKELITLVEKTLPILNNYLSNLK